MSSAAQILRTLGGPFHGNFCLCPAHNDRKTPNLKVTEKNGKVLVKCFAGCTQSAVIDALKRRDLWPTRRHRVRLNEPVDVETNSTHWIAEELLDAADETTDRPKGYLRGRGIKRSPPMLKLVGSGTMHLITSRSLPAMIAPVTNKDGDRIGVHVTFLTGDTMENAVGESGKVRRMYGKIGGGLVVLKPADPEKPFIVGEGIETVLSAMQVTGLPGGAAMSASNLAKIYLPTCSELIIAADADEAGMKAANELATRLAADGHKVTIAVPTTVGNDWNDELNANHYPGELWRRIIDAPLYQAAPADEPDGFPAAVKPWHEPVDGAALLDELADIFSRHMVLPKGAAAALALWVVHCHAHHAFYHSPILFIASPTKRCGKTNLLSVLQLVVPKPVSAANVTTASVFRVIEMIRPTLLIDEADTFVSDKSDLRGVLNSGHTRTLAYVLRCLGEKYTLKLFSTWCPKAFAAIGRLHPTLEDRSIKIELSRKLKTQLVERVPARDNAYDELRRMSARWAADNMTLLEQGDPDAPSELSDRARDNWAPLLGIADTAGGNWPERARDAARRLSSSDDDEGEGEMLLHDLRIIFNREKADALWTETIVEALVEMEDRPWDDFKRGKPITAHALARLLKPFQVFPLKIRIGGSAQKRSGYLRKRVEPVWRRYLDGDDISQTGRTGQSVQNQRVKRNYNRAKR